MTGDESIVYNLTMELLRNHSVSDVNTGAEMNSQTRRRFLAGCSVLLAAMLTALPGQAATPLKIMVYGGTGRIGQRIVDEALNRGHAVTVVVRDPSKEKIQNARLKVRKGDVLETVNVAQLMADQDVLVSSVSGFDLPEDFFPRVARSLVQAARSVGAKAPRILWVGGASSLPTEPGGRPASETSPDAKPFQKGKQEALAYLRTAKDVSWTELTPPTDINPGVRTGKFRLGNEVLLKDAAGKSAISMEDYAVALLDEIERPRHVRARFTVAY